jgi:Tfp pilus assembly protein PilZ
MKRLLIGEQREDLLATLEIILKHWGYRVLASSRVDEITDLLRESQPDFVVIGCDLLSGTDSKLRQQLQAQSGRSKHPLIALGSDTPCTSELPHIVLNVPVDIFELFEVVQKHLEKHPRRNLRMAVKLPGMVCRNEGSELAEVLSISSQGLFIKTTFKVKLEDTFQVIFPLTGMNQELELEGRVVYRMEPGPENNYRQGVGIEFSSLSSDHKAKLEHFLEQRLLDELTEGQRGKELNTNQLRTHSDNILTLVNKD